MTTATLEHPKTKLSNPAPMSVIDQEAGASEIIARRVTHSPVGLSFDPATTFDEWQAAHLFYTSLNEKSQWYLGDSIRFGESKFGEKYAQAIQHTGAAYSTLTTIVSVCERMPIERRREALPFGHHEAVAYIDPSTADELLAVAEQEQWTRQDLRDAVAKLKGNPTAKEKRERKEKAAAPVMNVEASKVATPEQSAEALLEHFVAAIQKLDVPAMNDDQRSAWLERLVPVDEFIDKLQTT